MFSILRNYNENELFCLFTRNQLQVTAPFMSPYSGRVKNAHGGAKKVSPCSALHASLHQVDGWYTDTVVRVNRFYIDLSAQMSNGTALTGNFDTCRRQRWPDIT